MTRFSQEILNRISQGENVKWCSCCGKVVGSVSGKGRAAAGPSDSTSRHLPNRDSDTHPPMSTAANSEAACGTSTDGCTHHTRSTHTAALKGMQCSTGYSLSLEFWETIAPVTGRDRRDGAGHPGRGLSPSSGSFLPSRWSDVGLPFSGGGCRIPLAHPLSFVSG